MITDRIRHFFWTVILYSVNCVPCRMLMRITRNCQQCMAVRHALKRLARNRLHRKQRQMLGCFLRHSRNYRWISTTNPARSLTVISKVMNEALQSLLIRFLRLERNSLRFLRKSLRSIRWITNYMKEFSRRSLRLWIPVSGWK